MIKYITYKDTMLFINAKVYTRKLLAATNCDSRPSIHLIEFEGFIDGGCIKHTRYNKGSHRHKLHKADNLHCQTRHVY